MYSFLQRTVNDWNKLSDGCIDSSNVNVLKIDLTYTDKADIGGTCWILNQPGAALLKCHVWSLQHWMAILLNKSLYTLQIDGGERNKDIQKERQTEKERDTGTDREKSC